MKRSSLRKKSPAFRQGYRTGRDTASDDQAAAFGVMLAENAGQRMTEREEAIAEQNFQGGKRIGYCNGYDDGLEKESRIHIASTFIVAVLVAAAGVLYCVFVA